MEAGSGVGDWRDSDNQARGLGLTKSVVAMAFNVNGRMEKGAD